MAGTRTNDSRESGCGAGPKGRRNHARGAGRHGQGSEQGAKHFADGFVFGCRNSSTGTLSCAMRCAEVLKLKSFRVALNWGIWFLASTSSPTNVIRRSRIPTSTRMVESSERFLDGLVVSSG